MKHRLLLIAILLLFSGAYIQAYAQKPVLVAATNHGKQNKLDSVSYKHSNGRQSIENAFGELSNYKFDTAYYWGSYMVFQTMFVTPKSREYCTYDNNDSLLAKYYDIYDPATKTYIKKTRERYTYNAYGNVDSMLTEKYSDTALRYIPDGVAVNTYNQQQQLLFTDYILWHTGFKIWSHTGVVDSYKYNSVGKLVQFKKTYSFLVHGVNNYTYNSNGLLATETLTYLGANSIKYDYEYYPNTLLKTKTESHWDTNLLLWLPKYKTLYNYNADSGCAETLYMVWDNSNNTFTNGAKDIFTYNNYNQLIKREYEHWISNQWQPAYEPRYYYYAMPTGINNIDGLQQTFALYPIPASGNLHISFEVKQPANLHLTIRDLQGRVIKQMEDKAIGQYHKSIAVQDIAPGQYVLQVKGEGIAFAKQFIIIK